jgi:hypothetical protein
MLDLATTREELEELATAADHIARTGQVYISERAVNFWKHKAEFLRGLSDVLEQLETQDLTLTNLQTAAEQALIH